MECKRFISNQPTISRSLFIFFSISSLFSFTTTISSRIITTCPDIRSCSSSAIAHTKYIQESKKMIIKASKEVEGRRFLGGLGSSPPRCQWKCGSCTPCKAVHVPVPPGKPVTAEYYPEAWRCKCRNKLYMP